MKRSIDLAVLHTVILMIVVLISESFLIKAQNVCAEDYIVESVDIVTTQAEIIIESYNKCMINDTIPNVIEYRGKVESDFQYSLPGNFNVMNNSKAYENLMEEMAKPSIRLMEEPECVDFNFENSSITNISNASAEDWSIFLNQLADDRELSESHFIRDSGYLMTDIESMYGISGTSLLAIWLWESSLGTSELAQERNNLGGIKKGSSYRWFDSCEDCAYYHADLLRRVYVDEGLTSWSEISSKYCPGNDVWANRISSTVSEYNEELFNIMNS